MKTELQQALDSINETVGTFVTSQKSMQTQLDAIDASIKTRLTGGVAPQSFVEKLKSNEQFQRLIHDRRGKAVLTLEGADAAAFMQRKTTITEVQQGFMTTGVMPIERIPGITPEARQVLQVRDVLSSSPTSMALVDYVKVSTPMTIASPVPEASAKPENQLIFTSLSEKVRTLATWIPASKQILDDFTELGNFISGSISYYVGLEEEIQLLSGDGTGENLHGLIPQATVFNTAGLPAGSTKIDVVGAVVGSIQTAKELPPTFAILHPSDWWSMRLLKDTLGRYILGDPQSTATARLFDLDVVSTTSINKGTYLVGSGSAVASEIRDRQEMVVEVSTEHQDFFVKNLVAVRGEKRLCLIVKRPASYVTGSFGSLS